MEIGLYEVALNDDVPATRYGTYPVSRIDLLSSCLTSTIHYFDALLSLPSQAFLVGPYTMYAQSGHALAVLSRLLLFEHQDWDRAYAKKVMDFGTAVDTMYAKIEAGMQAPLRSPDVFRHLMPRLKELKESHEVLIMASLQKEREKEISVSLAPNLAWQMEE